MTSFVSRPEGVFPSTPRPASSSARSSAACGPPDRRGCHEAQMLGVLGSTGVKSPWNAMCRTRAPITYGEGKPNGLCRWSFERQLRIGIRQKWFQGRARRTSSCRRCTAYSSLTTEICRKLSVSTSARQSAVRKRLMVALPAGVGITFNSSRVIFDCAVRQELGMFHIPFLSIQTPTPRAAK